MLNHIKGDLFTHVCKDKVVLAHACNPFGSWGGGIAAQFRKRYPYANEIYATHCHKYGKSLLGTCLLVPAKEGHTVQNSDLVIACLFTSDFETSVGDILKYTQSSMNDLQLQLQSLQDVEHGDQSLPVINMPQINSGIFNVPWSATEAILEGCEKLQINVYTL